jgi:hypothetical protein
MGVQEWGCPTPAGFAGVGGRVGARRRERCYHPSVDAATFLTALWRGIQAFFRAVWAALTRLLHQITGVFFFLFFAVGAAALVRQWDTWPPGKLAVTAVFTAVFAWFTVSSFWRARKRPNDDRRGRRGRRAI